MEEKELFQHAQDILSRINNNDEMSPQESTEEPLLDVTEEKEEATELATIVSPTQTTVPMPWKMSKKTQDNIAISRSVFKMEHGILSGVPIICRTYQCPYQETCWIPEQDLKYGERCPIEIAAILERYESYKREMNIRESDETDKGLLKELVDIEVMILRCDNLLATKGHLIDQIVSTVGEDGTAYYKPEISKEAELKERLRKERHRILNLLNSTRKDKKQQAEFTDPSSLVSGLMQKLRMAENNAPIIDVDATEVSEE